MKNPVSHAPLSTERLPLPTRRRPRRICGALKSEEGISDAVPGRAFLSTAFASTLQLFLSGYREGETKGAEGVFTVIARKEFTFQEITVSAGSRQQVKDAITRCATRMQ